MTSRTLKVAGWLAMASASLTLPLLYLSFKLEGRIDLKAADIQTIIQVFGTFLFVAIILYFKKLLNSHFKFHNADRNIELMIAANVVTGVLSIVALYLTPLQESIGSIVIAILVIQGIVQAQFGYKLLKLPNELGGMLKPFCYANMATGILLVTIILIPLGIVVSTISDLMLGTIFLNMSKSARNDESRP